MDALIDRLLSMLPTYLIFLILLGMVRMIWGSDVEAGFMAGLGAAVTMVYLLRRFSRKDEA